MSAPPYRLGHDLVDVPRFARALARHREGFRRRVFTPAEWEACERRPDREAALAVRFAAKEATFKALGSGWGEGAGWREVEVVGGGRTAPALRLHGRVEARARAERLAFAVSLTHAGGTAGAVVLAWVIPAGG
jgi:holo-[acyl-carrier protein] synthase